MVTAMVTAYREDLQEAEAVAMFPCEVNEHNALVERGKLKFSYRNFYLDEEGALFVEEVAYQVGACNLVIVRRWNSTYVKWNQHGEPCYLVSTGIAERIVLEYVLNR
jgi:hypothetical protein